MMLLRVVCGFLLLSWCGSCVLSQPTSYPPPSGTKIEPARVDPPSYQDAIGCYPDSRIPPYTPHYNLSTFNYLNSSLVYRLSEADVTGPMSDLVVNGFLSHWMDVNITTYRYGSGSVGVCLAGQNTTTPSLNHPYCDMAVVSREIAPVTTIGSISI